MEAGKVTVGWQGDCHRPGRCHGQGRRQQLFRRRSRRLRALGLPDLRFVFRYVYRQLDELSDRGARLLAPRQRYRSRHARRSQGAFSGGRPADRRLCRRYYEQDDASVLPRSIGSFEAFENAMTLDVSMGGSTNTVLHILAAAQEGGVNFTMDDIDRISRQVPCLAKVAPATPDYHIEDVHRAGGIFAILGELDRAGLIHREVPTVHATTLGEAIDRWDVMRTQASPGAASSSRRRRAAFRRRRLSRRTGATRSSIWIAPTVAFATRRMPTRRMVAWPCSTAISRVTAAS
jgi:hypothetical protein